MYGVVLWSDRQKNRALIWCEDHRNLAYFSDDTGGSEGAVLFGPGDLVEFDIQERDDVRFAVSPTIVSERYYPTLAEDLLRSGGTPNTERSEAASLPGKENRNAHVLPFPKTLEMIDAFGSPATASNRKFG